MAFLDYLEAIHNRKLAEEESAQSKTPQPGGFLSDLETIHEDLSKQEAKIGAEERGYLGDLGSAVSRGVVGAGEMVLQAARTLDPKGGVEVVNDLTTRGLKSLEGWKETTPLMQQSSREEGPVWGSVTGGVESAVQSISAGLPGAAVAVAGAPAMVGFALSAGTTFGLAQYDDVMERGVKKFMAEGKTQEEAERLTRPTAVREALYETGGEILSDLVGAKILGLLGGPEKKAAFSAVKDLFTTSFKEFAKKAGGVAVAEVGSEMGTAAGQAEEERALGIGDQGWWDAAKAAFGPALTASMILVGAGQGVKALQNRSMTKALEDPATAPEKRMAAVNYAYESIKPQSPTTAEMWRRYATDAVQNGRVISADDSLTDLDLKIANLEKIPEKVRTPEQTRNLEDYRAQMAKYYGDQGVDVTGTPVSRQDLETELQYLEDTKTKGVPPADVDARIAEIHGTLEAEDLFDAHKLRTDRETPQTLPEEAPVPADQETEMYDRGVDEAAILVQQQQKDELASRQQEQADLEWRIANLTKIREWTRSETQKRNLAKYEARLKELQETPVEKASYREPSLETVTRKPLAQEQTAGPELTEEEIRLKSLQETPVTPTGYRKPSISTLIQKPLQADEVVQKPKEVTLDSEDEHRKRIIGAVDAIPATGSAWVDIDESILEKFKEVARAHPEGFEYRHDIDGAERIILRTPQELKSGLLNNNSGQFVRYGDQWLMAGDDDLGWGSAMSKKSAVDTLKRWMSQFKDSQKPKSTPSTQAAGDLSPTTETMGAGAGAGPTPETGDKSPTSELIITPTGGGGVGGARAPKGFSVGGAVSWMDSKGVTRTGTIRSFAKGQAVIHDETGKVYAVNQKKLQGAAPTVAETTPTPTPTATETVPTVAETPAAAETFESGSRHDIDHVTLDDIEKDLDLKDKLKKYEAELTEKYGRLPSVEEGLDEVKTLYTSVEYGPETTKSGYKEFDVHALDEAGNRKDYLRITQMKDKKLWAVEKRGYRPGQYFADAEALLTHVPKEEAKAFVESYFTGKEDPHAPFREGKPISEYQPPANPKLPRPLPTSSGQEAWVTHTVDGKSYYSDGRIVIQGKPPKGLDQIEDEQVKDFVDQAKTGEKQIHPVAFYNAADRRVISFDNGGHVDARFFDVFRKKFPDATYHQVGEKSKRKNSFNIVAVKQNGEVVGVIYPLIMENVPDKVKELIEAGPLPPAPVEEAAPVETAPVEETVTPEKTGGKGAADQIQEMSMDELDAILDEGEAAPAETAPAETPPDESITITKPAGGPRTPRTPKTPKPVRAASDILKSAAEHGAKGLDEAVSGLFELFGGKALKSGPGAIDEDTYAKAKPHFQTALAEFQAAGKDVREFVKWAYDSFSAKIKPYLRRFMEEMKAAKKAEKEEKKGEKRGPKVEDFGEALGGKRAGMKFEDRVKAVDVDLDDITQNATPEQIAKSLINMTARSEHFNTVHPVEGRTPGVERYLKEFREKLPTYADAIERDRSIQKGWANRFADKLVYALKKGDDQQKLVKAKAAQYISVLEQMDEAVSTALTVMEARQNILKLFVGEDTAERWVNTLEMESDLGVEDGRTLYSRISRFYDEDTTYLTPFGRAVFRMTKKKTDLSMHLLKDWDAHTLNETEETRNKDIERRNRRVSIFEIETPDKYRNGRNITGQELQDVFGFRGGDFGEWVENRFRQRSLDLTYDSFKMLAETLGAPDLGMSIDDDMRLGIGWGARGKGEKAAAMFYPANRVIGLTKPHGDGSLAHEWAHALDYMTRDGKLDIPEHGNLSAINDLKNAFKTFYNVAGLEDMMIDALKGMWSETRNRAGRLEAAKKFMRENAVYKITENTKFFKNAMALDGGEVGKYWSKPDEMFARAFEAYVSDKLQEGNRYLVDTDFVAPGGVETLFNRDNGAYPTAEERERFNRLFDNMFDQLEWSEKGEPHAKEGYNPITTLERKEAKEAVQKLLKRIDAVYEALYGGKASAGGLYWYAYEQSARGVAAQPKGYLAYDDSYQLEKGEGGVEYAGKGAVAYDQPLKADDALSFFLKAVDHPGGDTIIKLEVPDGTITDMGDRGSEALAEAPSEHGSTPGSGGGAGEVGPGGPGEGAGSGSGLDAEGVQPGGSEGDSLTDDDLLAVGGGGTDTSSNADAVHVSERLDYIIRNTTDLENTNLTDRFNNNIAAIRTLKQIEAENRTATAAEQEILVKYNGWGELSEALGSYPNPAWAGRAEIVKSLLTDQERWQLYENAVDAYYTPPSVAALVHEALGRLGFMGGKVLEPSCGIGHFFGTMARETRRNSLLTGVDIDPISARIAAQLYQNANILNQPFEKTAVPNNFYDLTISNVPFGQTEPVDRTHNLEEFQIHDYFISKMINITKPGGLTVVLTSTGTMDKEDAKARRKFAESADLVSAIRLPNGVFPGAFAGADILIFRKKGEGLPALPTVPDWVESKAVILPEVDSNGNFIAGSTPRRTQVNNFFQAVPENVLGDLAVNSGRYGAYRPYVAMKSTYRDDLRSAIDRLPVSIYGQDRAPIELDFTNMIPEAAHVKNYNYYVGDNGKIYQNRDGRPSLRDNLTPKEQEFMKGVIGIRGIIRNLLRAQVKKQSAADLTVLRKQLRTAYDQLVKTYGPINKPENARLIVDDPDGGLLLSLEKWDRGTKTVTGLADIFFKNTLAPVEPPTSADTSHESLLYSLQWRGRVDLAYMGQLTGKTRDTLIAELKGQIFDDPETGYVAADAYLSGNVRRKLAVAEAAAALDEKYKENVEALKIVMPVDLPMSDIRARLGMSWVPAQVVQSFVKDGLFGGRGIRGFYVDHVLETGMWNPHFRASTEAEAKRRKDNAMVSLVAAEEFGVVSYKKNPIGYTSLRENLTLQERDELIETFGSSEEAIREYNQNFDPDTDSLSVPLFVKVLEATGLKQYRINLFKKGSDRGLIDYALNGGFPVIEDKIEYLDENGNRKTRMVTNIALTDAANAKLAKLQARLSEWVYENDDAAAQLEKTYNERLNSFVDRQYNGEHLTFPGKVPDEIIKLRPHQKNAIWRFLQTGATYFAHEVGTGKTYTMIGSIMEARRLGLAKKPVLIVKKATVEQIAADFLRLYPGANILTIAVSKTNPQKRQRQLAQIATGNYDCVIMNHNSFERIKLSPDTQREFLHQEIQRMERVQSHADSASASQFTVRQIGQQIKALRDKLDKLSEGEEGVPTFEEMGLDLIVADEAHTHKNIGFATQFANMKGVESGKSNIALDLFLKTQYLHMRNGRGIILASGTPLTNSVGELFNIQRYLQPNELTRLGIDTFDAWANTFGVMRKEAEYAPEGGHFKMTSRFAEFVNVPELLALARQVMDVRQAKDLGIVRPDVIGGKPEPVMVEWNKFTEAFQDLLKRRIRSIRALGDKATFRGVNDNILRVVSDGRTVAMDPRLYDPTLPDYENTKVNVAVDKVWDLYQKAVDAEELDQSSKNYKQAYQEKNHLQLIFADRGVPGKKDKFNIYADIKQKLIKKGIPKEQIAFIHDAKSDDDLAALLLKARKGQIRVLIGSTPKMGIGVNVQDRVSYIHHLDVDWTYANYEQRNGRGWRYGNRIKNVGIFNYGTVKTVDAFMWSTVAYKEKVLQQIMSNNPKIRNIIDISKTSMDASEMEGLLADDPIHKEKIELDEEVRRLSNVKADYESGRRRAKEKLAKLPLMMTAAEKTIERSHIHKQIAESIMAIEFKPQHDNLGRLVEPNRHFNLETEGGKVNALARKLHAAWTAKKTADSPDSVYLGRFGRIVTVETPDAKGKPKKSRVFLPLAGHLSLTVGDTALVYKIGKDVHYQAPMADGVKSGLTDIERSLARTIQEKLKSIQDIKNETPKLEKLIATPFPQEEELARKTQRLEAITQELLARQQAEEAEARRRAVEGQQDAEMEQEDNYLQDYLRFSRGQAQSSSKASDIQAALSPVIDRWKAGPKIQIVQSLYGLPDDVKEKVQKLLSRATDADGLEGLYDPATGAVYLIADYLESADRAQQVVLHEVVGHHGMRGVLGDRFKPFLKEAVALYGQKGLKDIADLYGLDLTEEADRLIAADEKIAEMAEAGENPAFLKRLYAAIREGLRRLGFNIQLSENDIKAMLVASRKALEKAGPKSAENLEGVLGAAKKIASTDAFKKWFGNSKVVDENGEPLVVYHGSDNPEFKAFDIGRLGENTGAASALRGFFFAKSADNAEMYTTPDITSEAFLSRQKEVYDQFNKITQKREGRARQQMKSLPKPVKKAKASLRELDIAKREYDAGKLSKKQYEDRVLDANDVLDNTTKDDVAVAKKLYAQDRRLTVEFYEAKLEKDKVDYFVKMYLQRDRYAKFNPGIIPAYLSIKNPKIHDFNHEVRGDITFSEILDEAIADGNDGVIFKNVNDPITDDIYVVFSPTQIKSIFNRGTFDPSNPDIHASLKSKMRDEVTSTVQAFKKALHPKDMTFLESMLRTPEYIDHPTVKQAYDATQHREERKNEIYLKHKDPVDRLSALRKADPAEYAKVEKILDDMDVNEVKWSEMRSKSGLSAEGLAAVDSVRKTFDELLEYLRQPVKDIIDTLEKEKKNPNKPPADQGEPSIEIPLGDGRKQKYTLSQLLLLYQEMGELKGFYAPRSREPGEYFLTAKDKDGNFYRFHKGSQRQIEKLKLQLGREGYTNFRDGLVSKLPEDIQMNLNIVDMGKAIEYAVNQAVQHPALNAALQGEVLVSASNMLKARAFRAHKIARTGRDGEVVRGYITDPAQRVGNYVAQIAGGIAKAEAGQKMMAALMDVDAVKEPKRYSWLKGYVTEQMRNADRWDRAIALGKSIVSFKYLGFNPRSALVNVTAQATTAPPAILKFALGGKGSLLKIGQELFTAGKDYGAFMGGKEFANEEERTFMADVHTRGVDNPQLVREAMRELDQGFGGVWSKVMDKAMWMFGKTEQWNRGTTLLAAYRMARAQGQNAATAAKNAQLATERAHGVYGKGTLPTWAMGTNPFAKIAQTGYTFQKFAHNYVQMLFEHKLNRQDAKGLAFALAAPAVLGGASGFAGYAAAMAIARGILGAADDDRDPEKMVYDTIRKTLGDTAEKGARYGIMGLLGVDISGSLAIGLEVPKTLTDLTGPFGGVATDIQKAGGYLSTGQPLKAAEKALPAFASNLVRAFRELDSVTTSSGKQVWDKNGKPYRPSTTETMQRASGFRGSERAMHEERQFEAKAELSRYGESRGKIYERYRAYVSDGAKDPVELKIIMDQVAAYNNRVLSAGRQAYVPLISREALRGQINRMRQPGRRERALLAATAD